MEEIDKLRERLSKVQGRLQLNPMDKDIQKEELESGKEFKRTSYLVELMLVQQSKATWLRLGDDNTKHFHSVLKQ